MTNNQILNIMTFYVIFKTNTISKQSINYIKEKYINMVGTDINSNYILYDNYEEDFLKIYSKQWKLELTNSDRNIICFLLKNIPLEHTKIIKLFEEFICNDLEKVNNNSNWLVGNAHKLIVNHLLEYKEKHSRFFKLNDILHESN